MSRPEFENTFEGQKLDQPVQFAPGVGATLAQRLEYGLINLPSDMQAAIDEAGRATPEDGRIAPSVSEDTFLPASVIPLDQEARDQRKLAKLARNPQRLLVAGGKRVVAVKVKIPVEQYAGLQRFEGATDSEKINAILRMANRRVDVVAKQAIEEQRKAQDTP